jgi:hypothetical protein
MLIRIFCFVVAVLLSTNLAAGEKKIWACKARGDSSEDLHLVQWGQRSYVKLYENRIWGSHYPDGDDLRWDFGQQRNGYAAFSAVLKPSGKLDYYDFRTAGADAIEASYNYTCRVVQG